MSATLCSPYKSSDHSRSLLSFHFYHSHDMFSHTADVNTNNVIKSPHINYIPGTGLNPVLHIPTVYFIFEPHYQNSFPSILIAVTLSLTGRKAQISYLRLTKAYPVLCDIMKGTALL